MAKRLRACLLTLVLALTLSGCWNYRGLNQMNIVVGMAIDFDKEKNLFDISYEVADLSGSKESSVVGKIIHSQGKSLFDTARNAKRKEADRLFFGSTDVLVINQQLAREMNMLGILDWFLRDGECRETMCIAISQGETAAEILERPEGMEAIMSSTLHDIIREDKSVTGTSTHIQLYEAYNALHSARKSAVIPALRNVQNGTGKISEINGSAIIKGDRLAGFLSPEQSRYVLLVEEKLESGLFTLRLTDTTTDDITLEIFSNKAKKSYTYEQDRIVVKIETKTNVAVAENHSGMDMMDEQVIKQIEDSASLMIQENIINLMAALQNEFKADIFGFGEMIYKKDPELWNQISPLWDEIYPFVGIEVSSEVKVTNSAFIK